MKSVDSFFIRNISSRANSPIKCRGAELHRLGHAGLDGLAHARHGQQKKRFLNCAPILRREQNAIVALAGNMNGLMRLRSLIDEAVEIGAGLAGGENGIRHRERWVSLHSTDATPALSCVQAHSP